MGLFFQKLSLVEKIRLSLLKLKKSSQKLRKIKIEILFLILLLMSACNGVGNTKSNPYQCYSKTIEESKKNGVFRFEVVADKSILTLEKYFKVEIKHAWIENMWWSQPVMIGKSRISKTDTLYQLIMKLKIDTVTKQNSNKKYFYFIGNENLDTFIHYNPYDYHNHITDTIEVPLYRQTTTQLPSKRKWAFDSLIFIKTNKVLLK